MENNIYVKKCDAFKIFHPLHPLYPLTVDQIKIIYIYLAAEWYVEEFFACNLQTAVISLLYPLAVTALTTHCHRHHRRPQATQPVAILWSTWSASLQLFSFTNLPGSTGSPNVSLFTFQSYKIRKLQLHTPWPSRNTCCILVSFSPLFL